ncbi:multidrug effflux MFS transporter [Limoniibacter endophyticus]|uniref:Bcr/CflA family efflux transporter n=1 Tax=Limoniibacter endophyticus TaxID=1565040 RepID=A0A8J3GHC7_9HYPH|nr:multidrug effflux MFS transporter [Limoniibacter endophyticus]GHC73902.1 Bcr/CflA family drug resistance efflux transporter [Limoniibacter endophyticus]
MDARLHTAHHPAMTERRVGLIGAALVAIGPISLALFTPAMPSVVTDLQTTEAMVKMTLSLYFAGFAFAQLICGPLSDAVGRKPIILAFMGLYCLATIVAIFAPSIEWLIAARFVQGVGGAAGVAISRAMVRDLFTKESSARIMNLIGTMLGVGPAIAPTLGGITMEFFGWHATFILMLILGIAVISIVYLCQVETVTRDMSRLQPRKLISSYAFLLRQRYFLFSSLIIAGSTGALYTQATLLSFIMMNRVGLSPTQFGFAMLMQSGFFVAGTLSVRLLMGRVSAQRLVPVGLTAIIVASISLAALLRTLEPGFFTVMVPVGIYAYGIAFVMPAMLTASMAGFPHMAGTASALTGFIQMAAGLVGGTAAALMGDTVLGLATIVPLMGLGAVTSWLFWRQLPEPALANAVRN